MERTLRLSARATFNKHGESVANMGERKVVNRNIVMVVAVLCVVLSVSLVGAVANYSLILNGKDSQINNLNSAVNNRDAQISGLQNQVSSDNSTINSLNAQVASLQSQVASANSQVSSLNSQIATLQSQVSNLTAIIDMSKSKLKTLAFHVCEKGDDLPHCPNASAVYEQILGLNKGKYEILLLPEYEGNENWTDTFNWIKNNFANIPIMLDVFVGGPYADHVATQLSTDQISSAMAVCPVKWLRFAEVVSWHLDHNVPFPTSYVTSILNFCRTNGLKLFWTEYKVDSVFQTIKTYIAGFENVVTVSFSTNSGELEPADGFMLLNKMFPHWGGSVQSWYWETRHRGEEDPYALSQEMPISLLVEHSLLAKYMGAEVIQFEPYWYFFDNGEAKENLKLLETMLA
jgi:uncharacterized coiled-coil protein SlyX